MYIAAVTSIMIIMNDLECDVVLVVRVRLRMVVGKSVNTGEKMHWATNSSNYIRLGPKGSQGEFGAKTASTASCIFCIISHLMFKGHVFADGTPLE